MAYIRTLSTRANLIRRRYNASFSYILHDDDRKSKSIDEEGSSQRGMSGLFQQRSFASSSGFNNSAAFGFSQDRRRSGVADFCFSPSIGASFCRNMSTVVDGGSDKIELMTDVAEVLTDTTVGAVAAQAPAVNEVAIAAADSFLPVAALQHVIDAVHSFTGFNWYGTV